MLDFQNRLEKFLADRKQSSEIERLTPDASTREYFRIKWREDSAIACVYPEPFAAQEQAYLDVTNLFLTCGLPVARIYDFDETLAVIAQEDFGDTILRDVLRQSDSSRRENLLHEAITLIARIQASTAKAFELDSVASRLKFDEEKLLWELNFFKTHYFETYRRTKLSAADDRALTAELTEVARDLERRAKFLCHRDFHSANLMLDRENRLRVIDHQDARIGSAAYDLVSLLLDRLTETPDENRLADQKRFFLNEREKLNLEPLDFAAFDEEFQWQTVQRCLKAVGTFSFQSVMRGKTYFVPFIEPTLRIVAQTCRRLDKFPALNQIIQNQLNV